MSERVSFHGSAQSGVRRRERDEHGRVRYEHELPPRFDLANHSPTGFMWGYGGSGPSQLALALCASVVPDEVALQAYHDVKRKLVEPLRGADGLPVQEWVLTERQVYEAIVDACGLDAVVEAERRREARSAELAERGGIGRPFDDF